jgi:hypothetical protein
MHRGHLHVQVNPVEEGKCLTDDGQGYWMVQKRLSQGRFRGWPQAAGSASLRLDPHQLHLLLWNGDPAQAQAAPMWRAGPRAG